MKVTVRYRRNGVIKTMAPQFAEVLHKMKMVDYHNPEPEGPVIKPAYDTKVMTAPVEEVPKKKPGRKKKQPQDEVNSSAPEEQKTQYQTKVLVAEEK